MIAARFFGFCALLVLTTLILLFIKTDPPEQSLYNQTVDKLMRHENLQSTKEVTLFFPELIEIQDKIEKLGQLKRNVQSISTGPAPNLSKAEIRTLKETKHNIIVLTDAIYEGLENLTNPYLANNP